MKILKSKNLANWLTLNFSINNISIINQILASDLEQDIEKMRKAIRAAATAQNDARFHRLPKSKSVIWQQITSGKHYSDEFVSRGILQPWVQVITELAREAAKTHYKDKKLHGKIERIHVDQGIDKKC